MTIERSACLQLAAISLESPPSAKSQGGTEKHVGLSCGSIAFRPMLLLSVRANAQHTLAVSAAGFAPLWALFFSLAP